MGYLAYIKALDPTNPSIPITWWLKDILVVIALVVVIEVVRFFALGKRIRSFLKKQKSKAQMYEELYQANESELDLLRLENAEKTHRIKILEIELKKEESQKKGFKKLLEDMMLKIIPLMSKPDEVAMLGTFKGFRDESMELVDIDEIVWDELGRTSDKILDDILKLAPPPPKDPE